MILRQSLRLRRGGGGNDDCKETTFRS